MKLQLTKDKTIDVKMPWERSAAGVSFGRRGPSDVTGVFLNAADPRGCPAVRLQRRKGTVHVVAAGFVPPPEGKLPASWDDLHNQVKWSLPHVFQAPQAALAVYSPDMFVRQTTVEALMADGQAQASSEAAAPTTKKLGVRRNAEPASAQEKKSGKPMEAPVPYVPASYGGNRSVTVPLAEESFILQAGLPEYQVLWLSRLLPEGRRPTACSVQVEPAALLASLLQQPDFVAADGTAVVVFVTRTSIYFAAYRGGALLLFRECPGALGYEVMRELVKSGLSVTDDLVESILENSLIDPRPALEPLVSPVLQQLQISLDFLSQRYDVHVDRVFLMGLSAGARYWSSFAKETIGIPFVSPGAFEGFGDLARGAQLPDDLTPGSSQIYLAALGAARAAMEGHG
ncbi:MAG: hypothetical protein IJ658_05985 [Kiritimatiellae bacterium]|nr:hypothetical protein [Kiritimatiellia bacterium]